MPADVLDTLIDARLLTSYELPDEEDSPQQRIEIIHESLLANWPRLVRWQTQEADSAQLRDQLRQAAQMWEERGHPEDLLWTGTSFDEFQLWRERYSGGLSAAEQSFAEAMTTKAERRKRRRHLVIAGAFTFLLAVLIVIVAFWRQSVTQAHRAEAQQLLMLGRLEIEDNPTGALAYALASLERADDPVTRLFSLEALWRGPTAFILEGKGPLEDSQGWDLDFSPDGRWLAAGFDDGSLKLWGSSGGAAQILENQEVSRPMHVAFGPQPDLLVSDSWPSHEVKVWSIPDGRLVRTLSTQGAVYFRLASKRPQIFTFTKQRGRLRIEAWPLRDGGPEILGDIEDWGIGTAFSMDGLASVEVDGSGDRFAFADGVDVRLQEIDLIPTEQTANGGAELVGRHAGKVRGLAFDPDGRHLASADDLGVVRIWDLEGQTPVPEQELHHPFGNVVGLSFDTNGERLAAGSCSPGRIALWDLKGPSGTTPVLLTRTGLGGCAVPAAFQPEGDWIATVGSSGAALWPLERRYPLDLSGHDEHVNMVRFLPDGRSLASTSRDGTLRLWPLLADDSSGQRILFDAGEDYPEVLAPGPRGEQILINLAKGQVWLVPVRKGAPRLLGDLEMDIRDLALGTRMAVASANAVLHVWDLETGEAWDFDTGTQFRQIQLTPDGRLISAGEDAVRIWNLVDGSYETFSENGGLVDLSRDGRLLLAGGQGPNNEAVLYDLEAGTSFQLDTHGPSGGARLDAGGETVLTKLGSESHLRVGRATGEAPHLLVSRDVMTTMDISPDGRWTAGVPKDRTAIRLWPVPDLTQPPLHTLPHDELLAKLRALTNLRVVRNPDAETGWGWSLDPFPGWETVPTW